MMKFVLLVLAVLVLLWLIKGVRNRGVPPPPPPPRAPGANEEPRTMVRCAQCGLHLPSAEALPGRGGVFCGDAHRTEYEKKHPST